MNKSSFELIKTTAILLLGGSGFRTGRKTPKQFVKISGKSLYLKPAETFAKINEIEHIVFVVPKGYENAVEKELLSFSKPHSVVIGGITRQESLFNALKYLKENGAKDESIVMVHDAARVYVSEKIIAENFKGALKSGAAVTAIGATDSIAVTKSESLIDGYLPREEIRLIQTPQSFRFSLLYKADEKAKEEKRNFTDEGSMVLAELGINSLISEGSLDNKKITTEEDLEELEESHGAF